MSTKEDAAEYRRNKAAYYRQREAELRQQASQTEGSEKRALEDRANQFRKAAQEQESLI